MILKGSNTLPVDNTLCAQRESQTLHILKAQLQLQGFGWKPRIRKVKHRRPP
jgi:hypothetical protein